jgi:hypothetical protein
VTIDARSLSSQAATSATSRGSAMRPSGIDALMRYRRAVVEGAVEPSVQLLHAVDRGADARAVGEVKGDGVGDAAVGADLRDDPVEGVGAPGAEHDRGALPILARAPTSLRSRHMPVVLSDLSFSWPNGRGRLSSLNVSFGPGRTGLDWDHSVAAPGH